jgi:hypothetical protein
MEFFPKIVNAWKAVNQLGPRQVGLYALYRLGLASGHYRRVTAQGETPTAVGELAAVLPLPQAADLERVLGEADRKALLAAADEVCAGRVRLFGADPLPLQLTCPAPLAHWTDYERGRVPLPLQGLPVADVKYLWEPARFGWAFLLGRAHHLSREARYVEAFWSRFEEFERSNPPGMGPHWMSGQEVALRLMAFIWAGQVFAASPASTPARRARLAASVAAHAARIPPTLVYARSQHNNHLLTEAAGLLSAGLALPHAPQAGRWRDLGWRWLNRGLQAQIDPYGEYAQHSTNYHRLMLQVVLWVHALLGVRAGAQELRWSRPTLDAISRSVHWLLALLDAESGRTPNLGANDGAYIFPLSTCPFEDFRPVLHAAGRAFLDYDLPAGPWDELSLWFGARAAGARPLVLGRYLGDQLYGSRSWAYFRTAQFHSRPSHADQLHLDLWWRGHNIARDAGTYLYNAAAPWDNALRAAFYHNTVTVDGRDQMRPAGRFMYLDWCQAFRRSLPGQEPAEVQRVRGRYRSRTFRHTRTVCVFEDDRWQVLDEILPLGLTAGRQAHTARLHWLLPDWAWELTPQAESLLLRLSSPGGGVNLSIHGSAGAHAGFSLVRAGDLLAGEAAADPRRGWTAPTYGVKIPALSLAVCVQSQGGNVFFSEFTFLPEP